MIISFAFSRKLLAKIVLKLKKFWKVYGKKFLILKTGRTCQQHTVCSTGTILVRTFWWHLADFCKMSKVFKQIWKGSNASGKFKQCGVFAKYLTNLAKMLTKTKIHWIFSRNFSTEKKMLGRFSWTRNFIFSRKWKKTFFSDASDNVIHLDKKNHRSICIWYKKLEKGEYSCYELAKCLQLSSKIMIKVLTFSRMCKYFAHTWLPVNKRVLTKFLFL